MKAQLKKYSGQRLAAQIIIFGAGITTILTILAINVSNDTTDSIGLTLVIGSVATLVVYYIPHRIITGKMNDTKDAMIKTAVMTENIYDYKKLEENLDISRQEIKARLQKMIKEDQIQGKIDKKQYVPL